MSSFFNVWLPKGHKNVRENKGHDPLTPLEVTLVWLRGAFNNGGQMQQQGLPTSCLHFPDQKQLSVIKAHTHDIQREGPICPPWVGDGNE